MDRKKCAPVSGSRNFWRGNYFAMCAQRGQPLETKLTHTSDALILTQVLPNTRKARDN